MSDDDFEAIPRTFMHYHRMDKSKTLANSLLHVLADTADINPETKLSTQQVVLGLGQGGGILNKQRDELLAMAARGLVTLFETKTKDGVISKRSWTITPAGRAFLGR